MRKMLLEGAVNWIKSWLLARARFLGEVGLLTLLFCPGFALAQAEGTQTAEGLLAGADARIEQYRKGTLTLELVDALGKPVPAGTMIKADQTRHEFLFGSNIFRLGRNRTEDEDRLYAERFEELFNFATLPFYWWNYEREQGREADERTREVVQWCRSKGITTKGHPLAWNFGDPQWLPRNVDLAKRLQMDRIYALARRFRGQVDIWDVVNEPTQYSREETLTRSPILTEVIRQAGLNPYLTEAFANARAGNPPGTLIINDYDTSEVFSERAISQLKDESGRLLADVIGIQSHQHREPWSLEKIWEVCERFAVWGLPLHFTEVTFLSGAPGWEMKRSDPDFRWESTAEGEAAQAERVTTFYRMLFSHPAVEAITWWDLSDQGAWQGAPAGLIRDDMSPKPAYEALRRLIKEQWWTRSEVLVGANGTARLRGFYGTYRVVAAVDGRKVEGTFELQPKGPHPVRVILR